MGAGFRNVVLVHQNIFLRDKCTQAEQALQERLNVIQRILQTYGDRAYGDPSQPEEEILRSIQSFFADVREEAESNAQCTCNLDDEREDIYQEGFDDGAKSVRSDDEL